MNNKPHFFKNFFILLVASCSFSAMISAQNLWNQLTPAQQTAVKLGKQVLVKEDVPNNVWPRFHVYKLTKASPLQVAAVFWDVAYDANYIPDCLQSTVNGHPAQNKTDATYVIKIPFLPNEISRVVSEVALLPDGGYKIKWKVVSSRYSKSGKGSVEVIPYEGGALISYNNLVNPGSSIASLLRGPAETQVQQTVKAIVGQVEKEISSSPEQLNEQVEQLKKALGK